MCRKKTTINVTKSIVVYGSIYREWQSMSCRKAAGGGLPSCLEAGSNGAAGPCSSDGVVTVINTLEVGKSLPRWVFAAVLAAEITN